MPAWSIVVPVKGTQQSKSRLHSTDDRAFALAMALDTVEAALAVAEVIVVTNDGDAFTQLGARVVADPGAGLIGAIYRGLENVSPSHNAAVLLGDLPAVTPRELEDALEQARAYPLAIVADADGTGTALATATAGTQHRLAFGEGSRAAHVAAGYVELTGDWPGLRRDIDRFEQLDGLALGRHTAELLRSLNG